MPLPFLPNCHEARCISLAEQDRNLSLIERLKKQVHLSYCGACSAFNMQLDQTKNAMRAWRGYHEKDE